jgi:uncharacterized protein involved in exopolysaccharide biosynthesis
MTQDDVAQRDASPAWLINHLPGILWQRRYFVLAPFLLLIAGGLAAAFLLPTIYRSSATLLVQSQDLPTSLVEAPAAGPMNQRIARIREQVLSRGDLIASIEQNDLYPEERRTQPMSKVVERMRAATLVGAVASDIGESGSQNSPIAISMSFDYPDPAKAQIVLQSFVTRFLSIDTESLEDQAGLTVRFLQDQATKLQSQIAQIEGQLTTLKARNGAALAGSGAPQMIDTGSFSAQIAALQSENRQLLSQPRRTAERNGPLDAAEAALAAAQAQFSDTHPDVVQARERVEQLRRLPGPPPETGNGVQQQIAGNNAAIQSLIAQRDAALSRANSAMAGQARAPAILEQAMQLENRASQLRSQYQQVAESLLKAQNGARMTTEQRAERLSLVEPASLPDRPFSPNRPLIIAAAAAAGLAFGLLLALIVEIVLKPIRSPRQLEQLGLPLLGVVPLLKPHKGLKKPGLFRSRGTRLAA